ncbi:MAG: MmcQ/YjbR family DNA-binding protein [Shinella sp.]|nr:MmcQ/YjbR family DNA-binding protein [Shinella sp.]
MSDDPLLARLQRLAHDLPGVETGTSYGTPALKVAVKLFVRIKDAKTVGLMVPLNNEEHPIEMAPEFHYEADHCRGWPALLVRATTIDDAELRHRLAESWRLKAPAKLRKLLD